MRKIYTVSVYEPGTRCCHYPRSMSDAMKHVRIKSQVAKFVLKYPCFIFLKNPFENYFDPDHLQILYILRIVSSALKTC